MPKKITDSTLEEEVLLPDALTISDRVQAICLWAYRDGMQKADELYDAAEARILKQGIDPVNYQVAVGRELQEVFTAYNNKSTTNRFLVPQVGLTLEKIAAAFEAYYLPGLEDTEKDKVLREEVLIKRIMADVTEAVCIRILLNDFVHAHELGFRAWKTLAVGNKIGFREAYTFPWRSEGDTFREVYQLYELLLKDKLISADTGFVDFYGVFTPNSRFKPVKWTGEGIGRLIFLLELLLMENFIHVDTAVLKALKFHEPLSYDPSAKIYPWLFKRVERCFTDSTGSKLTKLKLTKARSIVVEKSWEGTEWRIELEHLVKQLKKSPGR
ncbi:hypothetical protein H8S95_01665 [Pontibacter sp. KCTC 32443]|uniref:hypothetical protein n=1 Tax=Pontibacter TaxID=323449 RepID=UPI00164DBE1A|nr:MULTISPECIES: hypothetical protein [Pontibacter]MBC5772756.1 hypothetical protein [Pontibacter sp. KCTC 32443]